MYFYVTGIFIILFITQLRVIFGNDDRAVQLETISLECAQEFNIKDSFVDTQNVSHDYKCFVTCTFTKMGYVDAEGNTIVEGYQKDYLVEAADLQAIEACAKDNTADDLCEKVFMVQTCNMVYFDAKE